MVDHLIITDIYAAREKDVYNVSSQKLEEAMQEKHPDKNIRYMGDFEGIAEYVGKNAGKDDIIITMGAGDVYKIGQMLRTEESKGE